MATTNNKPIIIWFRNDLRLEDNPALTHSTAAPIIPVFIWDEDNPYNPGSAAKWWLNQSLMALEASFEAYGIKLILRRGKPQNILDELVAETGAKAIYCSRCYDSYSQALEKTLHAIFQNRISFQTFNASLLIEPATFMNQSGKIYQIFTPFWQALKNKVKVPNPLPIPPKLQGYLGTIASDPLASWQLHPSHPDWSAGLAAEWNPGEADAHNRLQTFIQNHLSSYDKERDHLEIEGTSKLSPHLHWGEISPRQVWYAVLSHDSSVTNSSVLKFLSELAWREFSYYQLFYFPELPHTPLRKKFMHFPWLENQVNLRKWQQGMTGFPIIDAGMRQLWQTGWMHNRVRMIVASFLVKDLLIPWQEGAAWFMDTLVDADVANNAMNWQWVAGSGVDAAPYFRIFNPITQSQKFDPNGHYIRKWVPELKLLPDQYIHAPWEAPQHILNASNITYSLPIVDHKAARQRALEAFKLIPKLVRG